MKKTILALSSLMSVSAIAGEKPVIVLNTSAIPVTTNAAPLIDHGQVSKAIKSNDFTQLVKLLGPLKDAITQLEAQNNASATVTDPADKDKAPVNTTADIEAQQTGDDNIIGDAFNALTSLLDTSGGSNLTSLVNQAEILAQKQAQAAASPTNSMSAGRRAITGVVSLIVGGVATYFGIVEPIEKKQDGTIVTGFMTAGGLVLYGFYDLYLAITNKDAKAAAAHAQAAASTLKVLHTKAQTVVANSPRSPRPASKNSLSIVAAPTAKPKATSVNPPTSNVPATGTLIEIP